MIKHNNIEENRSMKLYLKEPRGFTVEGITDKLTIKPYPAG
jgi:hypothetical protein